MRTNRRTDEHLMTNYPVDRPASANGWYFLNATFGRCADCLRTFEVRELIIWHPHTRETLHPQCCVEKYPHLAEWMSRALAPSGHVRDVEAAFLNWSTAGHRCEKR
jgi:hypothetical protein